MNLTMDRDLQSLLEFMQINIPASKLVAVADCVPQMARLLWGGYSQEPLRAILLDPLSISCAKPPISTEYDPALVGVGGDSEAVVREA